MADTDEMLATTLGSTSMSDHLLSKLKNAHQTARAALETEFGRLGITVPQFLALALIHEKADISSAELARQSYVSPQAMITIVARLAAANLIRRAPASGGGRSLAMRLTPEGEKLLHNAHGHAAAIERYIAEELGSGAFVALLDGLDRVTEALSNSGTVTKTAPWDRFVPPES